MFFYLQICFSNLQLLFINYSMCRVQTMISQGLDLLQFFTTRQWDFKSQQYQAIAKNLTPDDFELFDMDIDRIDTKDYLKRIILGGRQYCLKEPLSTLPKARMQLKALWVLDKVAKAFMIWLLIWGLLKLTGFNQVFQEIF